MSDDNKICGGEEDDSLDTRVSTVEAVRPSSGVHWRKPTQEETDLHLGWKQHGGEAGSSWGGEWVGPQ